MVSQVLSNLLDANPTEEKTSATKKETRRIETKIIFESVELTENLETERLLWDRGTCILNWYIQYKPGHSLNRQLNSVVHW